MDRVGRRIARGAGVTRGDGLEAVSPIYMQSTKFAGANLGVFANPRAAARDAAVGTSAPVRDCATRILPAALEKRSGADSISYRNMSSFKVPGLSGATGHRLLVGLLVGGQEMPIAIDSLDVVRGRTHLSLTVSNAVTQVPHTTEVAALAAMVKQLRTSLR
jgi:hypothetical protein